MPNAFSTINLPLLCFQLYKVIELNDVLHLLYVVLLTKRVMGSPYLQINKVVIHVVNLQPYQKIPYVMHNGTT